MEATTTTTKNNPVRDLLAQINSPDKTSDLFLPKRTFDVTVLQNSIIPAVNRRLATIDSDNVHLQRQLIQALVTAVGKRLDGVEGKTTADTLRNLRTIALNAFDRSFDIDSSYLHLPQDKLASALKDTIIPAVKKRLEEITPQNIVKQRDLISAVVRVVEERLVGGEQTSTKNLLGDLRKIALNAFVRSFEVAPPPPSELIAFCRDYLSSSSKTSPLNVIKIEGLEQTISSLSETGQKHLRIVLNQIPKSQPTDQKTAERVLNYLPETSRSLTLAHAPGEAAPIKEGHISNINKKIDLVELLAQFKRMNPTFQPKFVNATSKRLKTLKDSDNAHENRVSSQIESLVGVLTEMIVLRFNANHVTMQNLEQIALIIRESAKAPNSAIAKNAIAALNKLTSDGLAYMAQRFRNSPTTTKQWVKYEIVQTLPKLLKAPLLSTESEARAENS